MSSDDPSRREVLRTPLVAATVGALGLGLARHASAAAGKVSVPRYVLDRLAELGCDVLFGVPGATCDPLFHAAESAGTRIVVPSSDLGAGYAADGFARTKGLAAVSVTYGVGTMALLPVIAGAYAEHSPIVVINGGPSGDDLRLQADHGTLFSHSSGGPDVDLRLFSEVTAHAVRVERASDLPAAVDEALTIARTQQRPVYVEIAKHLWWADCPSPTGPLPMPSWPDGAAVTLADQVGQRLATAERPVVLVGCQVARLGLHDAVEQLLDRAAVPWVSTMLGKGVLDEQRAGFAGVYAGKRSVPDVRSLVEQADLVVAIGAVMGRQYRTLATAMGDRLVRADLQGVRIGDAAVQPASLPRWVEALTSAVSEGAHDAWRTAASLSQKRFEQRRASVPERDEPAAVGREPGMRYDEVLSCVSEACSHDVLLMSDTSLSMYPAAEANLKGRGAMLCNAVWAAIGYSAGACVGAALGQGRRPLVVCGDGGFQMTSEALSALARYRLNAVVLVLDNAVYGIEQWLLDPSWHRDADRPPRDYLGLAAWDYVGLAKAMGVSGVAVGDVGGLRTALSDALAADGPRLIAVKVKPHDLPRELRA